MIAEKENFKALLDFSEKMILLINLPNQKDVKKWISTDKQLASMYDYIKEGIMQFKK